EPHLRRARPGPTGPESPRRRERRDRALRVDGLLRAGGAVRRTRGHRERRLLGEPPGDRRGDHRALRASGRIGHQVLRVEGEGGLGPRPTVEVGLFVAGDRQRRLVPISCSVGPPVEVKILGDRNQRVGGIRAFYDCLRSSLPADARARVAERLSDEDLLGWTLAGSIVANPAGEYEIVARYRALESGFWHEPVLSNPVRIR